MDNNATYYNCQITRDFKAPKRNGGSVMYKELRKNNVIVATPINASSTPNSVLKVFKTTDGYIIPENCVHILSKVKQHSNVNGSEEIEYAEIVEDKPKTMSLPTPSSIKTGLTQSIQTKSKIAVNGALIGLGVGLVYAMMKQKNKLMFSALGSVGGFFIGNLYNNYINEDKK